MRIKLFLLTLLTVALPGLAQQSGLRGVVVDSATGVPVAGAAVMLNDRGAVAMTGPDGTFVIDKITPGSDVISIAAYGYDDLNQPVTIAETITSMGNVGIVMSQSAASSYSETSQELLFDQNVIEDEEGNAQNVNVLTGSSDNIFNNAASYNFSLMRFRVRGYDSFFNTTYVNGIPFNDLARGRFNYSSFGGMNRAFRNRTTTMGMNASTYGFGSIGGSSNVNTMADSYAPGFYGSVSYTNAAYMLRAMALYSTGINKHGWGLTVGAVGRYANEGVIPGTFYNSGGYFLSVEKQFSDKHSLSFTTYGAPTERATNPATFLEAYDLAGDNLYNPAWGWQNGKKRSSRIVNTYDPTFILNWVWKPSKNTTVNTGFAARWTHYSSSAFQWNNANDPKPDYYRNLPSYWSDNEAKYDFYTELWKTDESFRQIDWDALYHANYLNNYYNVQNPDAKKKGSTYILEDRNSNQENFIFNTVFNHRFNEHSTMQGGVTVNYTSAHYFKTVRDLLGGEFWLDVDPFSERDFPTDPNMLQNNLMDPNRKVQEGDIFGYNYYINAVQARAWLQNMITLPHWDINYGLEMSYTTYYRDGHMQNGRAPHNSFGRGATHSFDNGAVKAGFTYKLNGRNSFTLNAQYGSRAPLFESAYISPRVKDDVVDGLKSTRELSVDLAYNWNYRRFRGSISGFYTNMYDVTERTAFYDDANQTFMNYVLKGVKQNYMGVELGMAFKILPSLTLSAAGTVASYRYKNNPMGVRSYENNTQPDVETQTYLKNYHIGGTPQKAVTIGLDWAAPKMWFFNVNATWMGDSYVNLSPIRHESLEDLWTMYPDAASLEQAVKAITSEEKLNNAFTLNASIGKMIYLNRTMSLNINLNVDNILNRKNIMTYGYQQGRFDYTNFTREKYANKYYFAQGIKVFVNVGLKF